jgi:hypothetical protein
MDEIKILVCLDKGGVSCVRSDHPDVQVEVFDIPKKRRDGYSSAEIEADWDMIVPRYPHAAED